MAASPNIVSHGDPMIFTQSEATAAQATWVFYLSNAADGTPATGKTIAGSDFRIAKAGGAFGNATGTVTEMSLGWYKMVFAAGDLDTIGSLACELSVEAGVDTLHVMHQVTLFDLNIATAPLATGGIVASTFAAGAIDATAIATDAIGTLEISAAAVTEITTGIATAAAVAAIARRQRTDKRLPGSITTATGSLATGMLNAIDCVVQTVGTYGGGTITIETTEDPAATVPVWTTTAHTSTSNDVYTVTGPHAAVRARMSGATTPAVVVTFLVRYAV